MDRQHIEMIVRGFNDWDSTGPPDASDRTTAHQAVSEAIWATGKLPDGKWRLSLLRLIYERGRPIKDAMDAVHIAKSTAYRWRDEFLEMVDTVWKQSETGEG